MDPELIRNVLFQIFFFKSTGISDLDCAPVRLATLDRGPAKAGVFSVLRPFYMANSGFFRVEYPLWAVKKSKVGHARERDPGDRPHWSPGGGVPGSTDVEGEGLYLDTSHSGWNFEMLEVRNGPVCPL